MKNIIFWNVDTQKDFMLKNGKLYVPGAEEIIPKLKEITELGKKSNIQIINTGDLHNENSSELSDNPNFKTTFPPHCTIDSEGMEFIDETNPTTSKNYCAIPWFDTEAPIPEDTIKKYSNIIIYKDDFDVFKGNKFTDNLLKMLNPKVVVVYGVATDVCVKFAIQGLLKRNIIVILIEDAIKGLGDCKQLIEEWKKKQVLVITMDKLKNLINLSLKVSKVLKI